MNIPLPDFALVVLVGASGSGKSTFAATHFLPTETLSSDYFRGLVADDEAILDANADAFDALHHVAAIRLRRRLLTVIDATNVQEGARKALLDLAHRYHAVPVAVVIDLPPALCHARNAHRPNRDFGHHVVERHVKELHRSLRGLRHEGFRYVWHLNGLEAVNAATFTREPLWTDRRDLTGPFDIIGDVHGCGDELVELLGKLGYAQDDANVYRHPASRRLFFVGDLVDRGPQVVEAATIVMDAVAAGTGFCVPGNHDVKLMRALQGKRVSVNHGLQDSLDQIAGLEPEAQATFKARYLKFVDGLISHYWLDGGALVVAHAGMKEEMQGRASGRVRDFALYGETTGETDEFGLPVRWNWAAEYRGKTAVVYGHTPIPQAEWLNGTIDIDTGCAFGGRLTALRWPERVLESVAARRVYAEAVKPLDAMLPSSSTSLTPDLSLPASLTPAPSLASERGESGVLTSSAGVEGIPETGGAVLDSPLSLAREGAGVREAGKERSGVREAGVGVSLQSLHDDLLDIADFTGRRVVETRLGGKAMVAGENAAAALEVMSRYAVHPRWLMYLPPTMSPVETARSGAYLERPEEAFAYFAQRGVGTVVCQEKHMGSRAVLVVCRDEEVARRRFGATQAGERGVVVTRTGRPFFDDAGVRDAVLAEVARALEAAGLWDEWQTDWCCLDAEIMPWNAKARGLLREQYAPVAAIGRATLTAERDAAWAAASRGVPGLEIIAARLDERVGNLAAYADAYAHYCWPVERMDGLKIAPFHVMAVEGRTMLDRDHHWHIASLARLAQESPTLFHATDTLTVETGDAASCALGGAWWEAKTGAGGEGMVVKPLPFLPPPRCQPAVKVRGREYLRIIYGPEYTDTANLDRLRQRGLGAKRALAAKEFALGVEALERFVAREPLRRVHECVFGVLALESEPVDPRL